MPDEIEPATETPPSKAPDNMLKVLGYFTDASEQEKVPNPDAGEETTTPAVEETETTETPEGEVTETGETTETPEGEAKPSAKPAAPAIPKDQRAAKVKPSDALTKEAIADAVREGLTKKVEPDAPPVDTLAKYGDLLPQEKRALELAQFAARTHPDKYKDMEKREVDWIAKNREYIQKVVDEKGSFTEEDASSDEYRAMVRRHKPTYQPGDREDLLIERGVEKGLSVAEKRFQSQLQDRDRKMAEMEVRPQITKVLSTIEDDILSVLDKDVAAAVKADPIKAANEQGIEAPIAVAVIADAQATASEYLRISRNASEYNPDNPIHTKLVGFIQKQGQYLEQIPENDRLRDGKVLVSRERWATLPKGGRGGYCTFSDGDVIDMLAVSSRNYLTGAIKTSHERIAKSGFERRGAAPAAKPAPAAAATPAEQKPATPAAPAAKPAVKVVSSQPPKGGVSATPGAGASAKPTPKPEVNPALAFLGYDKIP